MLVLVFTLLLTLATFGAGWKWGGGSTKQQAGWTWDEAATSYVWADL
jgi:hypothetical protein